MNVIVESSTIGLLMTNLSSAVLKFVYVVGHCYSTNVAELLKQFAKDWDITKKFQVLVTDNARNMASAVNETGFAHNPCLICSAVELIICI